MVVSQNRKLRQRIVVNSKIGEHSLSGVLEHPLSRCNII